MNPEHSRYDMAEAGGPPQNTTPPSPEVASPSEKPHTPRLEDFINSPEELRLLANAAGGFSYEFDPSLPPERVGYTIIYPEGGGVIRINPEFARNLPKEAIRGFLAHEAGHHAPPAVQFQNEMAETLKIHELIPTEYQTSPQATERFLMAIRGHLQNALADCWLESYMGGGPFPQIKHDFKALYGTIGTRETLQNHSLPDQLGQLMVGEARYGSNVPLKDMVDPRVWDAFTKIQKTGAWRILNDNSVHTDPFASPKEQERAIQRKREAYLRVFYPCYVDLMLNELTDRKSAGPNKNAKGTEKSGMNRGRSSDTPLTDDEMNEIIKQITDELIESGKAWASETPSDEDLKKEREILNRIKDASQHVAQPTPMPETPNDAKALRERMGKTLRDFRNAQEKGLMDSLGIRQESIKTYDRIVEQYRTEIDSLASSLAEVFLDDRRYRTVYMRREGDIIPGLEYETISAMQGGELDPDTRMTSERNPEFLETEIEFIMDGSGSMAGEKLTKSVETVVIFTEAFKKVREYLDAEQLLDPRDEQPFRIGATRFTSEMHRVTKLDEPLSHEKELKMIDGLAIASGGTDERSTIEGVYGEFKLRSPNTIKIIMVFTDGVGAKNALHPLMRQIEKDDQVIFWVVGYGDTEQEAQAVTHTYLDGIKNKTEGNIGAFPTTSPKEAQQKTLEFLEKQVMRRRREY